jgi:hypothetical protein
MFRALILAIVVLAAAHGVAAANPPDPQPDDTALDRIAALIGTSATLELPVRVERAFMLTLQAADEAYNRGEIRRTLTLLRTFAFEVRSVRRAKRLPADAADMLLGRTEDAIRYLSNAVHLQ